MMQANAYDVMQKHITEERERRCEVWLSNADDTVRVLRDPETGMHYLYVHGSCFFKDESADVIALCFKHELYKRGEI